MKIWKIEEKRTGQYGQAVCDKDGEVREKSSYFLLSKNNLMDLFFSLPSLILQIICFPNIAEEAK